MIKPFRGCSKLNITQGFNSNHTAVDFRGDYGTWLVAPEKSVVYKITSPTTISENTDDLAKGYGIRLKSLERPNSYFLHWHCLPIFPVKEGEIVEAGQAVAQMGNSGEVRTLEGGIVPLEIRNYPPYPGTHDHAEMLIDGIAVDFVPLIDWSKEIPATDTLSTIQKILNSIWSLLKGRQ